MKFSFIIPTLDEEKRIKKVLSQFNILKRNDFEVIVADGGSKDNTVKIAKNMEAKVYCNKRKEQNAAKNRNLGAGHANGEILVFCDADTKIKDINKFTKRVKEVFEDKEIVAGMPKIEVFKNERIIKDIIFLGLFNTFLRISIALNIPFSSGQCQIIRKKAFKKIKGYNENIRYGEDTLIFKKLKMIGKLHYFFDLVVFESPRRYRKWGYLKWIFTGIINSLNQNIFGKELLDKWERVE